MKHLFLTGALFVAAFATPAAADNRDGTPTVDAPSGNYVSDPGHTSLHWGIGHMGLSKYTARVNNVDIALNFDASDIENSTVRATIDPSSVDTGFKGDKDFDAEISSPLIFNVERHPTIEFVSRRITQTGPTTADIVGDLTLLGVTKRVTLNATYNGSMESHPFVKVPAIGFSAIGTFDRTEFGLDFLSGQGLADDVEIVIETELLKQDG